MLAALVWGLVATQPELDVDLLPTVVTSTQAAGPVAAPHVPPEEALPEPRSYGWQPAAARGVGVLLLTLSLAVDVESARVWLATSGTLLSIGGAATLHALHGQGNNTMLSLVGSVVLSGASAGVGLLTAEDSDRRAALVLGVSAGQLAMAVLDLTWLGDETEVGPLLGRTPSGTPTVGFALAL